MIATATQLLKEQKESHKDGLCHRSLLVIKCPQLSNMTLLANDLTISHNIDILSLTQASASADVQILSELRGCSYDIQT